MKKINLMLGLVIGVLALSVVSASLFTGYVTYNSKELKTLNINPKNIVPGDKVVIDGEPMEVAHISNGFLTSKKVTFVKPLSLTDMGEGSTGSLILPSEPISKGLNDTNETNFSTVNCYENALQQAIAYLQQLQANCQISNVPSNLGDMTKKYVEIYYVGKDGGKTTITVDTSYMQCTGATTGSTYYFNSMCNSHCANSAGACVVSSCCTDAAA